MKLGQFTLEDRSRRGTQWLMEQEHSRVLAAALESIAYDILFPHSVTSFPEKDTLSICHFSCSLLFNPYLIG
jgi:hypothetical protein